MRVSWNWLKEYVALDIEPTEVAERLSMAGINHEGTEAVDGDLVLDLEVTSNRPDCLGHLGVAREIAVLWNRPLRRPELRLPEGNVRAADLVRVRVDAPDLCPRYIARVIRGAKIGPSPRWLADRLRAVNVASINNVVDVTNYVMLECGQPLHAFDLARLHGPEIIVRRAAANEAFTAIDHHQYTLSPEMCVIADQRHAVALAGVMGGLESEVTGETTDLLIESANFDPLAVRNASRALRLGTASSYRFERSVDPEGVDWASRRACQLILELAGGELAQGLVEDGPQCRAERRAREPIVLRLAQIPRILGIDLPKELVSNILQRLGLIQLADHGDRLEFAPPSWRRDLTREIDLIEEVARIHGYDEIPENVSVPIVPSQTTERDRVLAIVRQVMVATGFNEVMTPSMVDRESSELASPWTDAAPLVVEMPMLRGADHLRRTLIPSLLEVRKTNESLVNPRIELFEVAKVYLPRPDRLPEEPWMLALSSGRDYAGVKGVIEVMLERVGCREPLEAVTLQSTGLLDTAHSAALRVAGRQLGLIGRVRADRLKRLGLRAPTVVAEIRLDTLLELAQLIRKAQPVSPYPPVEYDFNFVVDQRLAWADLAATVRAAGGVLLESLTYRETYWDPAKDGEGTKRLLISVRLRAPDRTLTGEESDEVRQQIILACQRQHGARLVAGG